MPMLTIILLRLTRPCRYRYRYCCRGRNLYPLHHRRVKEGREEEGGLPPPYVYLPRVYIPL